VLASGHTLAAVVGTSTDMVMGRRVESLTIKNPNSDVCIVIESGSRGTVDSWDKVIDFLTPNASIFAYNRPGYGKSQETETPRDGSTIVEELRQVLKEKGLKPPYILVGHSLGGLYMQLFARRYPDEVNGLVLVDSVYPRVVKKPEDFPLLIRSAKRLFFSTTVNDEIDLIYKTGEQVLSLAPIEATPVVQLINKPTGAIAVSSDLGVFNYDEQTAAFVKGMYPKATKIFLNSDHQMQRQSPVEVADAIKAVIAMRASRK
jgi:pimeloyl-ACP methyl ester carboxylesterase